MRFTNTGGLTLSSVGVFAHSSTSSADGFNDTLVVSIHPPDANGYPGDAVAEELFELAEIVPSTFTTLPLTVDPRLVQGDFWVSFDLRAAGQPDRLVLVSGGADEPALDRAAARIAGEGAADA